MITLSHLQIVAIFIAGLFIGVLLSSLYFKNAIRWAMSHGRAYLYSDKRGWAPKHPHNHSYNDIKDVGE